MNLIRKCDRVSGCFRVIDEELCKEFGYKPHHQKWVLGWFDLLLPAIASHKSFDQVLVQFEEALEKDIELEEKEKPEPFEERKEFVLFSELNPTVELFKSPEHSSEGTWRVRRLTKLKDLLRITKYLKEKYLNQ